MSEVQMFLFDVVRTALGLVFLIAALSKLASIRSFKIGLDSYRIVPRRLVNVTVVGLITTEFAVGISLVVGLFFPYATLAPLMLIGIFGLFAFLTHRRGVDGACYCFGRDGVESSSVKGLTRISLMFLVALMLCLTVNWESIVLFEGIEIESLIVASTSVLLTALVLDLTMLVKLSH